MQKGQRLTIGLQHQTLMHLIDVCNIFIKILVYSDFELMRKLISMVMRRKFGQVAGPISKAIVDCAKLHHINDLALS